ncbi:unnamed protein product [Cylindrotheca closterium]|uniref:Phosphodiesterase n=1 Tax=Cylindrotheca closterium TaxID=2856 RepID=A0AAD2G7W2_9STRA|nr:unnamed protein product [Cylindrotheca closterium]
MFGGKRKKEKVAQLCSDLITACKQQPQDFDKILRIVDSYPKATEYRDKDGLSALHWCCAKEAKLEIVQYLGNARKGKAGLSEASNTGMCPLHYALREEAPIDVIEYLLKANPSVIAKESEGGWHPLHYACAKINDAKIVLTILKSFPAAAKKITAEEQRLPLHYAAAFQSSGEVVSSLIQLVPDSIFKVDKNEWTPLHMAAAYNDSIAVFEQLLEYDKQGIQRLANHSRIPLHIACLTTRPLEIVRFLYDEWPAGIKQADKSQHLPLEAAAWSGCSLEVMKFLVREYPQAANQLGKDSFEIARYMLQKYNPTKEEFDDLTRWLDRRLDSDGNTHEDAASPRAPSRRSHRHKSSRSSSRSTGGFTSPKGRKSSSSSSRSSRSSRSGTKRGGFDRRRDDYVAAPPLATIEDDSVAPNVDEELPPEVLQMVGENLHEACEYPQNLHELRNLIGSFPQAAQCVTHNGNLPLHTACLNKAEKHIIEYLLQQYPDAIRRADNTGNIPLHLACFSSLPFDSIEVLVNRWPESVLVKNDDLQTPITRARQPFYEEPSGEVIALLDSVVMLLGGDLTKATDDETMMSSEIQSSYGNQSRRGNARKEDSMDMDGTIISGMGERTMPDIDESIVSQVDDTIISAPIPPAIPTAVSNRPGNRPSMFTVGGRRGGDDETMVSMLSSDFPSDPFANRTLHLGPMNEETSMLDVDPYDFEPTSNVTTTPMADLFPNTTVVFADIVGFNAWSSAREPAQVFVLLETIHSEFDMLAYRYSMSRAESVGDSYVAVSGIPEPTDEHAVQACKFARSCLKKMQETTVKLEVSLGPDTADLALRIGIHSGQVTAGVMRGESSRFRLFGDTVGTADRMQNAGETNRIQLSQATADLVKKAGYDKWLLPRSDTIAVQGKGNMQTFWIRQEVAARNDFDDDFEADDNFDDGLDYDLAEIDGMSKVDRLVEWNVEVLSALLQQIIASRGGAVHSIQELGEVEASIGKGATVLEEFVPIIPLKRFDADELRNRLDPRDLDIGDAAKNQLRSYLSMVSVMYQDNPFHNFEHAIHVAASVKKLLSRIVNVSEGNGLAGQSSDVDLVDLAGHSYGITSDPLTQFAVIFSAIIHDADHPGVPNTQLVKENTEKARMYKDKSVAEQNSVDLCWEILMQADYKDLRACIYQNENDLRRFRQLVVNTVMATDIADKELQTLRKKRWETAFSESPLQEAEITGVDVDRKATIVIEHLIQASDVSHTMQHWHIYKSWNEKFFMECYGAYRAGRAATDPSVNWYKGEIGFFDFYVIPLAKKLDSCGVFGVSSDEYMNYAKANRDEWVREGEETVQDFIRKFEEKQRFNGFGKRSIDEPKSEEKSVTDDDSDDIESIDDSIDSQM